MKKIMIIEDCVMMRTFLERHCKRLGSVCVYESAILALNSLTIQSIPDVIILDLNLPGFGGRDFMKELLNMGLSRIIPILVLSGESDVETKIDCLTLGAVDFLSKPFHPKELHLRIGNILQNKIAVRV